MSTPNPDPAEGLLGLELADRVAAARAERDQALVDLRAVMSDDEIRDQFGLDVTKVGLEAQLN